MAMSSPIDCAALRATLEQCKKDLKADRQRLAVVEVELRSTDDPTKIAKLAKEKEDLDGDIVGIEAVEEDTHIQMSGHC
ncbi:hypothetical protein AB0D10_41880 [Kitasatospora sp. NPDC048545]|uniref:hypothetical protein n=1 Tax=Kitasatospora sp. NPDC048545 TaxID=3157208 RepID=UPI0033F4D238